MTTHSPYIAASLNNLLYADQFAYTGKKEQIRAIIPEDKWLQQDSFSAYRFADGTVEHTMDAETGMLCAEIIDQASDRVGRPFEQLIELDCKG